MHDATTAHRTRRALPVTRSLTLLLALAGCADAAPDPEALESADTDAADADAAPGQPSDPPGEARELTPCRVDADCDPGLHCALRVCASTCSSDQQCTSDQVCSDRGRCLDPGEQHAIALPPRGSPLRLVPGSAGRSRDALGARASVTLANDGEAPLQFRLAAEHPAAALDPAPRTIDPGESLELAVQLDAALLAEHPTTRFVPIQVITDVGDMQWDIELEPALEGGRFTGTVSIAGPTAGDPTLPADLGTSTLALDLEFHEDGTVSGRSVAAESFWWPVDITVEGTWTDEGEFTLELRDIIDPAQLTQDAGSAALAAVVDPLARPLGRELHLHGQRRDDGRIEGVATERLSGLTDEAIELTGSFALAHRGPTPEDVLGEPVDFDGQLPVSVPSWDYPLDEALAETACDGLALDYGTPETLAQPVYAGACTDCIGLNCSTDDALYCGLSLAASAYRLPQVLEGLEGGGQAQAPIDTWTWDDCMDQHDPVYDDQGAACLDTEALRCAGALLHLTHEDAESLEELELARVRVAALAHWRARAATTLATEAMIDAAFAYKADVGGGQGAAARELELLEDALGRLGEPLRELHAPGYLRALHLRDPAEHAGDDFIWITRALQLSTTAGELATRHARLAQRAGAPPLSPRAAAITLHARAALWAHELALQGAPDERGDLLVVGQQLRQLAELAGELGDAANEFGFSPAHVPLALGPADIENDRGNFESMFALAVDDLDLFTTLADDAWIKVVEYESQSFQVASEVHELEAQYDANLRALCGSGGTDKPDLEHCGEGSGQLALLRDEIAAANLRIGHARQAHANNTSAIVIEEKRFETIVRNSEALNGEFGALVELKDGLFRILGHNAQERSVARTERANTECNAIEAARDDRLKVVNEECKYRLSKEATSGYAVFGWGVPDPSAIEKVNDSCRAQREEIYNDAARQCNSLTGATNLENAIENLNHHDQKKLITYNSDVDAAIRASDLENQRANSEAAVKNLMNDSLLLLIEIHQAELARASAQTRIDDAYAEVSSLLIARARALGQLEQDPGDPLRNPAFLQARLEAGRRVLRLRETAIRRVYQALRALEYEINQPLPELRAQLLAARSPLELQELMGCLDHVHEDYLLDWGYPQTYVTDISLREDIYGIDEPIEDAVTGELVSPAAQFQAILSDPTNVTPAGVIELPFTVSPGEDWLFSRLLCDDRVESIDIKVVGDFLGDGELDLLIAREGSGGVRRCDSADIPLWSAVQRYDFEREQVLIQAGVNAWSEAGANSGYAAWPVHGEQWSVAIPPGELAPANADLNPLSISDIVVRIRHRAGTVGPTGSGLFTPSCGG